MVHSAMKSVSFVMGLAALALGGCATHATAPAGVPVHGFVADSLVLHGTAEPTLTSASCSAAAPTSPKHIVHLDEETRATIFLGPEKGQPLLPVSMLHITHLDTNRTWCVMTKSDGTPAALVGEFPSGLYSVAVAETRAATPQRYEVTFEKL